MKYINVWMVGLLVSSFAFAQEEWPRAKKRPVARPAQQQDKKANPPPQKQQQPQMRPNRPQRIVQPQQGQPQHVRPQRDAITPQPSPFERVFGQKPVIPGQAEMQRRVQQQQSNPQPVVTPPQRDDVRFNSHRAPPNRVQGEQRFPNARRRDPVNQRSVRGAGPTVGQRQPDRDRLIEAGRGRTDSLMRRNPAVMNRVNQERRWGSTTYRPIYEQRSPIYQRYVASSRGYHSRYTGWSRYRFYGGGYYGFNPVLNIELDFYNPLVYWFFVPTYSADYYSPWYGSSLNTYSALRRPFRYSGYFYPTESLRQLLFGVSAMSISKQISFREGIDVVTDRLSRRTTEVARFAANLGRGDIVVTHYEIVGYENAVALEGFVTVNDRPYNFKAIVDLRYPNSSDVFVTGAMDREPTSFEIQALERLNARVGSYQSSDTYDGYDNSDNYDDGDYYDDDDNE